ncbi:unnamed protein product [Discosporangium mesarthrocarpum]
MSSTQAGSVPKGVAVPTYAKFMVAGASGISAWLFVHPMDVIKVRMVLGGGKSNPVKAMRTIVQEKGFPGLYAGLSAAVMRQAVYTTLRLGLYDWIRDNVVGSMVNPQDISVLHRAATGLAAGGLASFMSCPIEVCMVRMQADGRLPVEQRLGYKHVGDALVRIVREEGLLTYWRGATPTVSRAMVVSMTQLGTYDQAKTMLMPVLGDNTGTHLASAVTAAVVYSFSSLPLDTAKTYMQSQQAGSTDSRYKSTFSTLGSIVKESGFPSLWRGFTPYFARSGGHTVLMFLFKEQYTKVAQGIYGSASH